MPDDIISAALHYLRSGFSVLPVGENKRPLGLWKHYQSERMTEEEAPQRFRDGARLAVICGAVSGNLEVMDFDDPAVFQPFLDLLSLRAPGLIKKIRQHKTPSGGYHIIYRCDAPPKGNQVFARDSARKVRIETRGEGGYVLVPPSAGYSHIAGDVQTIHTNDVNLLVDIARAFDVNLTPAAEKKYTSRGDAPGGKYNDETNPRELLLKYGWRPCGKTTAGEGWTRPGKEEGVSGVLLSSTGNFYCWTSNAAPLEPSKSYTPFGLLSHYEHDGDFSAAAKSLKKKGETSGEEKKEAEPSDKKITSISIASIMRTQYKTIKWAVPGIIPEGMTVLAGRPKFGKSWLMLGLAYAIATGGKAWNFIDVEKSGVHYLALEDSERRIQDRIRQMEGYFDEYPENLHIYTRFPRIGNAFADELTRIIERDSTCGLIIIDTLQKVRPLTGGKRGGANLYQLEYEDYEKIQAWSIREGVPVVCVHHTRKGDPSKSINPFDEVSGSTGIQGVADTLIVVDRGRGANEGTMYVTGREVSEEEYPMIFNKGTMTWSISRPVDDVVDVEPFILNSWFKTHDAITVQEAAQLLDMNQRTARRRLEILVDEGKLEKNKDSSKQNKIFFFPV